jgi:LmbE family N-acetylglucosaminyl deacetylase
MAPKWFNCRVVKAGLAAAIVLACGLFLTGCRSPRTIMVFAPHEDDEAICCSGVIHDAVLHGDTVKLVMVTTGDYNGDKQTARDRLDQTIAAMSMLGLSKDHILYFGYADATVLAPAYLDPSGTFASWDGKIQETYGFPDINMPDYHSTVFKKPGRYNRADISSDIYDVLNRYRPQHIYIPSPIERHEDHAVTGLLAIEAVLQLKKVTDYAPVIHEYMIYKQGLPQTPINPTASVDNSEAGMDNTPYAWALRESVAVSPEMTQPFTSTNNLKYNALRAYGSNTWDWFDRFIRTDEVFWPRYMTNKAFSAAVTASSENASTGQSAAKVIDGVILGHPYMTTYTDATGKIFDFYLYDKEWATAGELDKAWIRLDWPAPQTISRVVLYDRPNTTERILAATLSFSDGTTESVGSLPNNGSAYQVDFPSRTVSWVQLTVDQADGVNIGLSEFEVF